jgi:hypothetical protein
MNSIGSGAGTGVGMNPTPSPVGIGGFAQPAPSMIENLTSGIQNLPSNIADKATSAFDTLTNLDTYSNLGGKTSELAQGTAQNISDAGTGIKNLAGLGTGADAASKAFSATGATLNNTALPIIAGVSGLTAMEEQQKYLDEQAASGAISNAEYNAAKARLATEVSTGKDVVSKNPLKIASDISSISEAPSLYGKLGHLLYAAGGSVVNPPDDQTGMPNETPMGNFDQSGIMSMIGRTAPTQMYAAGGIAEPRFLSGGGDGMSDSIPANISGKQEARLADGEFVIPADVVSHLGNGSSKAGAKQLYSMMDRVRKARTGNKMQGKQINPRKYMTA